MNDDDFKQTILDYINMVTTQRFMELMTSNQDVMNAIAANTAALMDLDATIKTAISDMGAGGDAARAQAVAAVAAQATQISTLKTELTAAIAAVVPPPATPTGV